MAEIDQNFSIYRGEAATQAWDIPGSNISGWTITFTLKSDPQGSAVLSKTCAITSATKFTLTLTHAETVTLAPHTYAYDAWRTDALSEVPLALGTMTVLPDVLY
jgi:hypothetical protein